MWQDIAHGMVKCATSKSRAAQCNGYSDNIIFSCYVGCRIYTYKGMQPGSMLPYVRARIAHPKISCSHLQLPAGRYYSASPPLAQGFSQFFLALPMALPNLQILYYCGHFMLSLPKFRGQSRLTIISKRAQKLFQALK